MKKHDKKIKEALKKINDIGLTNDQLLLIGTYMVCVSVFNISKPNTATEYIDNLRSFFPYLEEDARRKFGFLYERAKR